jgi:hypothetical protein
MAFRFRINYKKAILDALEGFAIGRTGFALPSMAMWRLNHYAGSGRPSWNTKRYLYSLKNIFIQMLYERSYCLYVNLDTQHIPCWHTRAYNDGRDDYCPKCDNTDIYRIVHLYKFVFEIGDLHYSWHQPVDLVDYPVKLDMGGKKFEGLRHYDTPYESSNNNKRIDAWAVWWCLWLHGYRIKSPLKLYKKLRPNNKLEQFLSRIRWFMKWRIFHREEIPF